MNVHQVTDVILVVCLVAILLISVWALYGIGWRAGRRIGREFGYHHGYAEGYKAGIRLAPMPRGVPGAIQESFEVSLDELTKPYG